MTINDAVSKYQATGCEVAFGEIYEYIYEGGRWIVVKYARKYKLNEHDVESMINGKLIDIATKFDMRGEFRNAVHYAIRLGCVDLLRKKKRRDKHEAEVMYEDDDGSLNEVYEILTVAPTTDESNIIEEIQKKHDQRQLVAFLISKADEQTLTSASAFIETNSYRKAAKQIGTTDKTIKSRIRKLANFYDCKKFGNHYDYLTVPTAFVG
ncbi:hypothetical protein MHZ92_14540 [Sporosarcina sp. ACRSL]|uniref:hypothetical protein n=1 Tax=Sporosarcina sp. ACRSL TaxID=2918215 RepID=UPI001EF47D25|nr:hypothetical protein [Sporosarcina sp. ACRSL]MCG7345354.1 hypothetical protein [Sporosarcina sp. ACRSL]